MAQNYRKMEEVEEETFPEPKPTKQYREPVGPQEPKVTEQYDRPIGPERERPQAKTMYRKPIGPRTEREETLAKVNPRQYSSPAGPEPQFPEPKATHQYKQPIGPAKKGNPAQYQQPIGPTRPNSKLEQITQAAKIRGKQALTGAGRATSSAVLETFLPRKQPQFSESTNRGRKILSTELREASRTRPHGKQHGPFNVIGVGTPRKMKYVTDGHGRSGQRATLEWRRENRQYQSEERKAKSETNRNWISDLLGQEPEPVRQRKVHTKGGKRISQLDRFVDSL